MGGGEALLWFFGTISGVRSLYLGRNPQRLCSCWLCSMGASFIFSAFLFLLSAGFSIQPAKPFPCFLVELVTRRFFCLHGFAMFTCGQGAQHLGLSPSSLVAKDV